MRYQFLRLFQPLLPRFQSIRGQYRPNILRWEVRAKYTLAEVTRTYICKDLQQVRS